MAKIILTDGTTLYVKETYEECIRKINENYCPKKTYIEFEIIDNFDIDFTHKSIIMISKIIMIQI